MSMEERTSGFKPVKKKKGSFNLVDLLLVLFVLALAFVVIFVMDPFSLNLFGGGCPGGTQQSGRRRRCTSCFQFRCSHSKYRD